MGIENHNDYIKNTSNRPESDVNREAIKTALKGSDANAEKFLTMLDETFDQFDHTAIAELEGLTDMRDLARGLRGLGLRINDLNAVETALKDTYLYMDPNNRGTYIKYLINEHRGKPRGRLGLTGSYITALNQAMTSTPLYNTDEINNQIALISNDPMTIAFAIGGGDYLDMLDLTDFLQDDPQYLNKDYLEKLITLKNAGAEIKISLLELLSLQRNNSYITEAIAWHTANPDQSWQKTLEDINNKRNEIDMGRRQAHRGEDGFIATR